MVPEGTKTMGSLTPGREGTKKQDNGSRCLAATTHSLKNIRVDKLARGAADDRNGGGGDASGRSKPTQVLGLFNIAQAPVVADGPCR